MSNKIPIDKSIPMPVKYEANKVSPYPFEDMEVGDSFFAYGDEKKRHSVMTMGSNLAAKRKGVVKFASRATTPDGFRVWRTA